MLKNKLAAALALAVLIFSVAGEVHADNWPLSDLIIITPAPPGGAVDIYARSSAQGFDRQFKRTAVVDNRAGAGGIVASDAVSRSKPDGHTLLLATTSMLSVNPSTYKDYRYGAEKFELVCKGVEVPLILVANASLGIKDVASLAAWLKANPTRASYASFQAGTPSHFLGHQLGEKLGLPLTHVAYRGGVPQATDIAAGNVPFGFTLYSPAQAFLQTGRMVALATTGSTRMEGLANVPTMAEQGYPDFTSSDWFGIAAPKGTPVETVNRLIQAHRATLADSELAAKFAIQGMKISPVCGREFAQLVEEERARWAKVVKATGFNATE